MSAAAIDFDLHLPVDQSRRRPRRSARPKNPGQFISRTVRQRNERIGRPFWQPTRSFRKFGIARTTEKAAAIREESIPYDADGSVDPKVFWANPHEPVSEYEAERAQDEQVVIAQRHDEILSGIEARLRMAAKELPKRYAHLEELRERLQADLILATGEDYRVIRHQLHVLDVEDMLLQNDFEALTPYLSAA